MSRGLISVLGAVVLAGGVAGVAVAQPAPAPAPDPALPPAEGSAVAPIEDAPPADMEGRDEDPDAPRGTDAPHETPLGPTPDKVAAPTGYPIEEAKRPITLPEGMSEIGIAPRFRLKNPGLDGGDKFSASDALRARYGITHRIQLGLTYVYGGFYDDPATDTSTKVAFHPGKAAGLDVTVLMTNWVGVRVGLPFYFDPLAMSLAAGAPMRFIFDKFTIGGLDDVLNITLNKFPPSFQDELANANGAHNETSGTEQSRGWIRVAGYGIYQTKPNVALIGRFGVTTDLGAGGGSGLGTGSASGTTTFLRAGVQFTPKKFVDVGVSAGFEDLAAAGSFGLAGLLQFRI